MPLALDGDPTIIIKDGIIQQEVKLGKRSATRTDKVCALGFSYKDAAVSILLGIAPVDEDVCPAGNVKHMRHR